MRRAGPGWRDDCFVLAPPRAHLLVPEVREGWLPLPDPQLRHLAVLRVGDGEPLSITDGLGHVSDGEREQGGVHAGPVVSVPRRSPALHVGVGVTQNMDRLEWAVEKLTELGVDSIVPVVCARSQVRGDRLERRLAKLHARAVAALEQSRGAWLPEVARPTPLGDLLAHASGDVFVARSDVLGRPPVVSGKVPVWVLVGPEGGWSADEYTLFSRYDTEALNLGHNVLRVETAALVAATRLAGVLGRFDR